MSDETLPSKPPNRSVDLVPSADRARVYRRLSEVLRLVEQLRTEAADLTADVYDVLREEP